MKVLQINIVFGVKSTGRTCLELQKIMEKEGHECYTAYGYGKTDEKNTYRIGNKLEYYLHNILSKLSGKQGYFSKKGTKELINYIEKLNPDIIHLRNLHANFLNLPMLFNYLSKIDKPIVQSLHDCWSFTGKCAYYSEEECYKWLKECGNCPKLKSYPESYYLDRTNKMYKDKRRWYKNLKNFYVIGVSKWIADEAKKSFLNKGNNIFYIYNWINLEVFKEIKSNIKEKYNLDKKKFTIIGVSAFWSDGSPRYEDFKKLSEILSSDIQLILIGKDQGMKKIPKNIIHIPFVEDIVELSKLYSSADVYVHLSREDTFGKVIAESLACGTPAVVYDTTACSELIENGKNGYKVAKGNIEEIYRYVLEIKINGKKNYSNRCREVAKEKFDYKRNSKKMIEFYQKIVNMK